MGKYDFILSPGNVDCAHPPTGILIPYENKSNVPLKMHATNFQLFFGERRLDDQKILNIGGTGKGILAPNESLSFGIFYEDIFVKELAKPRGFHKGPNIEAKFEAHYSRLGEDQLYVHRSHRVIQFDCENSHLKSSYTKEESIEQLK